MDDEDHADKVIRVCIVIAVILNILAILYVIICPATDY